MLWGLLQGVDRSQPFVGSEVVHFTVLDALYTQDKCSIAVSSCSKIFLQVSLALAPKPTMLSPSDATGEEGFLEDRYARRSMMSWKLLA